MVKKKGIRTAIGFGSIIIGCFFVYALFTSISSVYQRHNDLVELSNKKKSLEAEKNKLENEIQLLGNEDYVTRYARENYVFTREGEEVSIIPNSDE